MATPTSTKVPYPFKPEGSDVTYLIQVPDRMGKLRYTRAMQAAGGITWSKRDFIACARETLALVQIEGAEKLLEIVDRYEGLSDETPEGERTDILADWRDLSRKLHLAGGDFAARNADNMFWFELSPIVAARCFLIGIEGEAPLIRGADGLVPDPALAVVKDEAHLQLIGFRALALFDPSEAEAKNSDSPQPSSSVPTTSTAASAHPTAPAGTSSENISSEIQG